MEFCIVFIIHSMLDFDNCTSKLQFARQILTLLISSSDHFHHVCSKIVENIKKKAKFQLFEISVNIKNMEFIGASRNCW